MNGKIEVVVVDKETGDRIVVALFNKPISLPDRFPKNLANELFRFFLKNAGKLMGEPKEKLEDTNFFPHLLNKSPYILKKKEKK
ncbi:MAG: hypothetical protein WC306_00710 [Candidatus Paceibacterota bacterium]|jgi:hypothetical protein